MRVKAKSGKLRLVKPFTRRTGKIAKLPKELRDEINRMIQAGKARRAILDLLAKRGQPGIDEANLATWIKGNGDGSSGYNDWLHEQEILAAMQARCQFAHQVARHGDGFALHEAARLLATAQLNDAITRVELGGIKAVLRANPQVYPSLVTALRRLSREALEQERFRQLVRLETPPPQPESDPSKPRHLSPETIAKCNEAIARL